LDLLERIAEMGFSSFSSFFFCFSFSEDGGWNRKRGSMKISDALDGEKKKKDRTRKKERTRKRKRERRREKDKDQEKKKKK
jgi:hypothetical protein